MDCIKAREKIDLYVDDMLSEAEKQRLVEHASSCPQCKKALNDAIRLKQVLGSLGEVEPPAGLAASAVRKAKKRRIPIYAYATAAAAAVVALAFAFSPQLLNNNSLTGESGEEKIMFSAADANTEADEGLMRDSVAPEEAAGAPQSEVPQLECTLVAGSPIESEESDSAVIVSKAPLLTFDNEDEFWAAIQTDGVLYSGASYYRPAALPEGAELQQIEVSDLSMRWIYGLADGSSLTFEWLRTITSDDLQGWSDQTQISDTFADSFNHTGDVFWSTQARFNESAQMEATDGTVINAYWLQDGAAFHMVLPTSLTEEEIAKYCVAEPVPTQ